jgi:hypothetical protein
VGTSPLGRFRAPHRPNAESHGPLSGARPMCRPVRANSPPLAAFWRDVLCSKPVHRSADMDGGPCLALNKPGAHRDVVVGIRHVRHMAGIGEGATLSVGRVRGKLIHDRQENRRALVAL